MSTLWIFPKGIIAARIIGMVVPSGNPPTNTTRFVDNNIGSIVDTAASAVPSIPPLDDIPVSLFCAFEM